MTQDGEVQERKRKISEIGLWYYCVLFIGLAFIALAVQLYGHPINEPITQTQILTVIFVSLLGVIIAMCCLSFPCETRKAILPRKPAEKRSVFASERTKRLDIENERKQSFQSERRKLEYEYLRDSEIPRVTDRKSPPLRPKKPIPGVTHAITDVRREPPRKTEEGVEVRRGGEFIGNRMRFKVKVLNDSPFTI
ncbi:MAG: hypothetical protein ACFFCP_15040, partial [Promethearchaeota archaeon]